MAFAQGLGGSSEVREQLLFPTPWSLCPLSAWCSRRCGRFLWRRLG